MRKNFPVRFFFNEIKPISVAYLVSDIWKTQLEIGQ